METITFVATKLRKYCVQRLARHYANDIQLDGAESAVSLKFSDNKLNGR